MKEKNECKRRHREMANFSIGKRASVTCSSLNPRSSLSRNCLFLQFSSGDSRMDSCIHQSPHLCAFLPLPAPGALCALQAAKKVEWQKDEPQRQRDEKRVSLDSCIKNKSPLAQVHWRLSDAYLFTEKGMPDTNAT